MKFKLKVDSGERHLPVRRSKSLPRWQKSLLLGSAALLLAAIAAPSIAIAAPQGSTVVAGTATISTATANTTTINQSTAKAVIEWQSFSVATGETVTFTVPSGGATLNRVTGSAASTITGTLTSNGTLYLVNPNGIVFEAASQVTANGFIATTAAISNDAFTNASGIVAQSAMGSPTATISLSGTITSTTVNIYATAVLVYGTISKTAANLGGEVVISTSGGANSVTVTGSQTLTLDPLHSLAINSGRIAIEGGISMGAASLSLNASNASVWQNPLAVITAGTVTGTARDGFNLNGVNLITTLGVITNRGMGGVSIKNGKSLLFVSGVVIDGGAGSVSLLTPGFDMTLSGGLTIKGSYLRLDLGGSNKLTALSQTITAIGMDAYVTMVATGNSGTLDLGAGKFITVTDSRASSTAVTITDSTAALTTVLPDLTITTSGDKTGRGVVYGGTLEIRGIATGAVQALRYIEAGGIAFTTTASTFAASLILVTKGGGISKSPATATDKYGLIIAVGLTVGVANDRTSKLTIVQDFAPGQVTKDGVNIDGAAAVVTVGGGLTLNQYGVIGGLGVLIDNAAQVTSGQALVLNQMAAAGDYGIRLRDSSLTTSLGDLVLNQTGAVTQRGIYLLTFTLTAAGNLTLLQSGHAGVNGIFLNGSSLNAGGNISLIQSGTVGAGYDGITLQASSGTGVGFAQSFAAGASNFVLLKTKGQNLGLIGFDNFLITRGKVRLELGAGTIKSIAQYLVPIPTGGFTLDASGLDFYFSGSLTGLLAKVKVGSFSVVEVRSGAQSLPRAAILNPADYRSWVIKSDGTLLSFVGAGFATDGVLTIGAVTVAGAPGLSLDYSYLEASAFVGTVASEFGTSHSLASGTVIYAKPPKFINIVVTTELIWDTMSRTSSPVWEYLEYPRQAAGLKLVIAAGGSLQLLNVKAVTELLSLSHIIIEAGGKLVIGGQGLALSGGVVIDASAVGAIIEQRENALITVNDNGWGLTATEKSGLTINSGANSLKIAAPIMVKNGDLTLQSTGGSGITVGGNYLRIDLGSGSLKGGSTINTNGIDAFFTGALTGNTGTINVGAGAFSFVYDNRPNNSLAVTLTHLSAAALDSTIASNKGWGTTPVVCTAGNCTLGGMAILGNRAGDTAKTALQNMGIVYGGPVTIQGVTVASDAGKLRYIEGVGINVSNIVSASSPPVITATPSAFEGGLTLVASGGGMDLQTGRDAHHVTKGALGISTGLTIGTPNDRVSHLNLVQIGTVLHISTNYAALGIYIKGSLTGSDIIGSGATAKTIKTGGITISVGGNVTITQAGSVQSRPIWLEATSLSAGGDISMLQSGNGYLKYVVTVGTLNVEYISMGISLGSAQVTAGGNINLTSSGFGCVEIGVITTANGSSPNTGTWTDFSRLTAAGSIHLIQKGVNLARTSVTIYDARLVAGADIVLSQTGINLIAEVGGQVPEYANQRFNIQGASLIAGRDIKMNFTTAGFLTAVLIARSQLQAQRDLSMVQTKATETKISLFFQFNALLPSSTVTTEEVPTQKSAFLFRGGVSSSTHPYADSPSSVKLIAGSSGLVTLKSLGLSIALDATSVSGTDSVLSVVAKAARIDLGSVGYIDSFSPNSANANGFLATMDGVRLYYTGSTQPYIPGTPFVLGSPGNPASGIPVVADIPAVADTRGNRAIINLGTSGEFVFVTDLRSAATTAIGDSATALTLTDFNHGGYLASGKNGLVLATAITPPVAPAVLPTVTAITAYKKGIVGNQVTISGVTTGANQALVYIEGSGVALTAASSFTGGLVIATSHLANGITVDGMTAGIIIKANLTVGSGATDNLVLRQDGDSSGSGIIFKTAKVSAGGTIDILQRGTVAVGADGIALYASGTTDGLGVAFASGGASKPVTINSHSTRFSLHGFNNFSVTGDKLNLDFGETGTFNGGAFTLNAIGLAVTYSGAILGHSGTIALGTSEVRAGSFVYLTDRSQITDLVALTHETSASDATKGWVTGFGSWTPGATSAAGITPYSAGGLTLTTSGKASSVTGYGVRYGGKATLTGITAASDVGKLNFIEAEGITILTSSVFASSLSLSSVGSSTAVTGIEIVAAANLTAGGDISLIQTGTISGANGVTLGGGSITVGSNNNSLAISTNNKNLAITAATSILNATVSLDLGSGVISATGVTVTATGLSIYYHNGGATGNSGTFNLGTGGTAGKFYRTKTIVGDRTLAAGDVPSLSAADNSGFALANSLKVIEQLTVTGTLTIGTVTMTNTNPMFIYAKAFKVSGTLTLNSDASLNGETLGLSAAMTSLGGKVTIKLSGGYNGNISTVSGNGFSWTTTSQNIDLTAASLSGFSGTATAVFIAGTATATITKTSGTFVSQPTTSGAVKWYEYNSTVPVNFKGRDIGVTDLNAATLSWVFYSGTAGAAAAGKAWLHIDSLTNGVVKETAGSGTGAGINALSGTTISWSDASSGAYATLQLTHADFTNPHAIVFSNVDTSVSNLVINLAAARASSIAFEGTNVFGGTVTLVTAGAISFAANGNNRFKAVTSLSSSATGAAIALLGINEFENNATITASAGALSITGVTIFTGAAILSSAGNLALNGNYRTAASLTVTVTAAASTIQFNHSVDNTALVGAVTVTSAGGAISFSGTNRLSSTLSFMLGTGASTAAINFGGDNIFSGAVTQNIPAASIRLSGKNSFDGSATLKTSGDITIDDETSFTLGVLEAAGAININAKTSFKGATASLSTIGSVNGFIVGANGYIDATATTKLSLTSAHGIDLSQAAHKISLLGMVKAKGAISIKSSVDMVISDDIFSNWNFAGAGSDGGGSANAITIDLGSKNLSISKAIQSSGGGVTIIAHQYSNGTSPGFTWFLAAVGSKNSLSVSVGVNTGFVGTAFDRVSSLSGNSIAESNDSFVGDYRFYFSNERDATRFAENAIALKALDSKGKLMRWALLSVSGKEGLDLVGGQVRLVTGSGILGREIGFFRVKNGVVSNSLQQSSIAFLGYNSFSTSLDLSAGNQIYFWNQASLRVAGDLKLSNAISIDSNTTIKAGTITAAVAGLTVESVAGTNGVISNGSLTIDGALTVSGGGLILKNNGNFIAQNNSNSLSSVTANNQGGMVSISTGGSLSITATNTSFISYNAGGNLTIIGSFLGSSGTAGGSISLTNSSIFAVLGVTSGNGVSVSGSGGNLITGSIDGLSGTAMLKNSGGNSIAGDTEIRGGGGVTINATIDSVAGLATAAGLKLNAGLNGVVAINSNLGALIAAKAPAVYTSLGWLEINGRALTVGTGLKSISIYGGTSATNPNYGNVILYLRQPAPTIPPLPTLFNSGTPTPVGSQKNLGLVSGM